MANFQGISGIAVGDGQGGYVALSIQERVQRILSSNRSIATFLSATANKTATSAVAGRVYYRKPQVVQTNAYSVGQISNDMIQVGQEYVDINVQRTANYQYETFDSARIADWGSVESEVARSLALSIMLDHNAHFLSGLKTYFDAHIFDEDITPYFLIAPKLVDKTATVDEIMAIVKDIAWLKGDIEKTYSRYYEGVNSAEVYGIFDAYAEANINYAIMRGLFSADAGVSIAQNGAIGTNGSEVKVQKVWGISFLIDNLVNLSVPAGQSWAKDYNYDMSNYIGFVIHNEFAAMPLSLNTVRMVYDTNNANPKWIAKYGFGFGIVRPGLGRAIIKAIPKKANKAK